MIVAKKFWSSLCVLCLSISFAGMPFSLMPSDEISHTPLVAYADTQVELVDAADIDTTAENPDAFFAFNEDLDVEELESEAADLGTDSAAEDFATEDSSTGDSSASENDASGSSSTATAWMQREAPDAFVFDEYRLFSSSDLSSLEALAQQISNRYNVGVYFLICDRMFGLSDPTPEQRTLFATSYYKEHSLGLGSGKDGIMMVLAIDSRDYVTIAYGQGSYAFSDTGIAYLEDEVTSLIPQGEEDWYGAVQTYYQIIDDQLAYYDKEGSPYEQRDFASYAIRFIVILLAPFLVAFGVVRNEKAAMRTAKQKTEASDYLDQSSFALTASEDTFVNSSVVATPRSSDNDSGGSGGWGGGGGGGFSSSGGGKF